MVKVYAIALLIGFVGLLIVIMGGTLADNLDRPDRDPNRKLGRRGRLAMGAVLGFAMGGMAAEFSPLDFSWQLALLIAIGAGGVGLLWVRYSEQLGADG
jgi:MFS family permease